jgi:hypothetical protein
VPKTGQASRVCSDFRLSGPGLSGIQSEIEEPAFEIMVRRKKLHIFLRLGLLLLTPACGSDSPPQGPDVLPPAAIVDLLAESADADSALLLTWTAPGDDGAAGRAAHYEIRCSLEPPSSSAWDDSIGVSAGPAPAPAGTTERWLIRGLLPDSTYYVQIRAVDDAFNKSEPSNVAMGSVGDEVPPAPITDLRMSGAITTSRAELIWTATGDDGLRGRAKRIELRVSSTPIDAANWDQAALVAGVPEPADPGAEQSVALTDLEASRIYYFAIRAVDDAEHHSTIASSLRIDTPTILVRASDGSETGYPSLRAALVRVKENETIQLGPGVFDGPDNRDLEPARIGITIRGSGAFEGGTILDLERSGRAFYFHDAEATGTVVQELVIRNGHAKDTAPGFGGAIFCFGGASPTLASCVFENNDAVAGGGAVAARGGSSPLISQCRFIGNHSGIDGGALGADDMSRPAVIGCLFEDNDVAGRGGGIALSGASGGEIHDCQFQGNRADFGGAIAMVGSSPAISGCILERNHAARGGGALLCFEGSSPLLDQCTFRDNEAADWGGAIYCLVGSSPPIDRSLFESNSAAQGGALLAFRASLPSISRSTLVLNRACFGTAVRCIEAGSGVRIDRSILAFGGMPDCDGGAGLAVHLQDGAVAEVSCTAIFGNAGGDWVRWLEGQENQDGNVAADPRFCDPESGDFRLREGSPCLDGAECGLIGAFGGCGASPREIANRQ